MDVEILQKIDNPLLNRVEIVTIVKHPNSSTPKREEIKKKLAAILGSKEELMVVRKILSVYGKPISRVYINVYKDENTLRRVEPKHILKKNGLIE